jgi:exopolyphosphatase / guanosine-5'-triphosphate,3'-diphosphate pyrophosphatase
MVTRQFRLAALDIGSLTIRLGIAEVRHPAQLPQVLHRQEYITRLGTELITTGRLSARSRAVTLRVLGEFAALCRHWQVDRISAVATQAVRQAANQEDFLRQVSDQTGLRVEVLSPEVEMQLCLRGILAALHPAVAAHRPLVVFDLGGGSLEWAFFVDDAPPALNSLPFGALTLVKSWQSSDPPQPDELTILQEEIRRQLLPLLTPLERLRHLPAARLVGSGGAITTLATLYTDHKHYQPEAVNNLLLTRDAIEQLSHRLSCLTQASRSRLPGLSPAKADVIIPGAIIILEILRIFSTAEVTVMDAGLLEGVLGRLADQVFK